MPSTRRHIVLMSGLTLLTGCTSNENDHQQTEKENNTQRTKKENTTRRTEEETTTQETEEHNMPDPEVTLQFGESYIDFDLKITVNEPTFTTTFCYEEETYEMPDGEILAFVPVEFHNTNSEEGRHLAGPIFTLIARETPITETATVYHPAFNPMITIDEIERVPDTANYRWRSHGTQLRPNRQVNSVAVFTLSEEINIESPTVVYEPDPAVIDDRYGDDIVEWTQ